MRIQEPESLSLRLFLFALRDCLRGSLRASQTVSESLLLAGLITLATKERDSGKLTKDSQTQTQTQTREQRDNREQRERERDSERDSESLSEPVSLSAVSQSV